MDKDEKLNLMKRNLKKWVYLRAGRKFVEQASLSEKNGAETKEKTKEKTKDEDLSEEKKIFGIDE